MVASSAIAMHFPIGTKIRLIFTPYIEYVSCFWIIGCYRLMVKCSVEKSFLCEEYIAGNTRKKKKEKRAADNYDTDFYF